MFKDSIHGYSTLVSSVLTLWLTVSAFLVRFPPNICSFIDTQVAASPHTLSLGLPLSLQRALSTATADQAAWHQLQGLAWSSSQPVRALLRSLFYLLLHVFAVRSTMSPGVAHLARSMVEHLKDKQPELGITDRDVQCVQLAGLCHDLGHGPFSHVWDGQFIPAALYVISHTSFLSSVFLTEWLSPGKHWKHEEASEMMFDDLVAKNNIDLPEMDIQFIKALIAGDPSSCLYAFHGYCFFGAFHVISTGIAILQRNCFCLKSLQTTGTVLTLTSEHLIHFHISHP
jgi:hypothetical protein